jgi:hypothetical protein
LHRVKPHEAVVFLQDIKNDAAYEWNAGDGCGHV